MTNSVFATVHFKDQDRQVSWYGASIKDGEEFQSFMNNDVASRVRDEEGGASFEKHLRGLAGTGFARESLQKILAREVSENRDWAVGEALAESYLGREHGISWPWNMERDKRTPHASLPGADLMGFEIDGGFTRLAVGEVKTSSDIRTPPNVMNGRSGMAHQLDKLANDLSVICQLLKWLLPRCKRTAHEKSFNAAVGMFLESGNKAIALFGVLIRDTKPDRMDLQSRGKQLACKLRKPTTCCLIAIYLPCSIGDLPGRVRGGES